ncbi:MAG: hypothetical protein ABIT20_21340 [Gemmatimonadaceae bacterium]
MADAIHRRRAWLRLVATLSNLHATKHRSYIPGTSAAGGTSFTSFPSA